MSGMSLCPAFRHRLRSLRHQFFGTIVLMEFVLKNPCQQLCSFSLAPCQRSYACPIARVWKLWQVLGTQFFGNNRIDVFFPEKNPCQRLCIFSVAPCQRSCACPTAQCFQTTWKVLGAQPRGTIALMEFVLKPHASSSASQYVASSQWSSPKLSPSYFPRFRVRPPCRRFRLAPSQRSSPQANSHGSISLLPNGALPKL